MTDGGLKQRDKTDEMSTRPEVEYEAWLGSFRRERLKILYYLGLTANPVFIAADILLHRPFLSQLFVVRCILELGLIISFVTLIRKDWTKHPRGLRILLVLWILIGNVCIAQMTVILGGFTSQYYNGLNLVFLAAAVIVPISWQSHLIGQILTLVCYYALNSLHGSSSEGLNAAIENSFFLVWTCIALLFSVFLYEKLQRAEYSARIAEKQARQQLQLSHAKLLELDRMKSDFFANISHELRTPLTLSLAAFKSLRKGSVDANSSGMIDVGLRNTSRLLILINELLDLAKFDSGRMKPQKECIDLALLIQDCAANFEVSDRKRVHMRPVPGAIPAEVDASQMRKVLNNLLSNAFKFSDPDHGQVWIRVDAVPEQVRLEIEDNGIGIPTEYQQRIFDRFTQVEGNATRRYEGTGIGLALVKEIVDIHGGTISVNSKPGIGSTFIITLPRGNASADRLVPLEEDLTYTRIPDETFADVSDVPKLPGGSLKRTILVADDNPDMRRYLEQVLRVNYNVILAQDGQEALARAHTFSPTLILTDVMMPKMSGPDLLNAVRADKKLMETPVVFLTAQAGVEARVESFEAGADDYLAKPFDENELTSRLRNLIRARDQEREIRKLQKEKMARFLPSQVANLVMDEEELLAPRRTLITVLFVDLRGFTSFAETAQPEDVMKVLDEYQYGMGRLIADSQGTLERFSGDAIMVYFNAPLSMPNHPERTVRTAVAMRDKLDELVLGWKKRGISLGAGIGVAIGYATVGLIGTEERQDYAAIGSVTNLASRLCNAAEHGQILMPERLFNLVNNFVDGDSVGLLNVKGFHEPIPTYNVTAIKIGSDIKENVKEA